MNPRIEQMRQLMHDSAGERREVRREAKSLRTRAQLARTTAAIEQYRSSRHHLGPSTTGR